MGSLTKDLCALILTKVIKKGLCKKLIFEKRHKEARTRTVGKRKLPPKCQRTLVSGILKTQPRAGRATGSSGFFPCQLTETLYIPQRIQKGRRHARFQTSDISSRAHSSLAGGGAEGSLLCLLTLLLLWLPYLPSLSVSGSAGGAGRQSGHRPSRFSSAHCVSHTSIVKTNPPGEGDQLRRRRGSLL